MSFYDVLIIYWYGVTRCESAIVGTTYGECEDDAAANALHAYTPGWLCDRVISVSLVKIGE